MKLDADHILKRFQEAKNLRAPYESDWHEAAKYLRPRDYGRWQAGGRQGNNVSVRGVVFDDTAIRALPKYVAVLDNMCTPQHQVWHDLRPTGRDLKKIRAVQNYFGDLNEALWNFRYAPRANFGVVQSEAYMAAGIYGTAPKFIGKSKVRRGESKGSLHYRSVPLPNIYVLINEEGQIDTVFRQEFLNARQWEQRFGKERLPNKIQMELDKAGNQAPSEMNLFELVHVVAPQDDYDVARLDNKRFPFFSVYIAVDDKMFVRDPEGYRSFPYVIPRIGTASGDLYGSSPAMTALGAIGSANTIKKTLLKQGNKAVDPTLLAYDDGVMGGGRFDARPARINYGTLDAQGRELVKAMQTGNFDIGKDLLLEERTAINDPFFVNLFQILLDSPEQTATEVVQKMGEKAALLAPTMSRMQTEDLGPTIEREIEVLYDIDADLPPNRKILPEMPPELIEAEGEYTIEYTSPMAKSLKSDQAAGFMRAVGWTAEIASAKQDPSMMDVWNFDVAIPEIAEIQNVPYRWVRTEDELAEKRDEAQQQQGVQQGIEALPGVAGMVKAAASVPAGAATGAA